MFMPNWTEQPEPGGRELYDPEAIIEREVGVQPPPEATIELLRAVDICDRDDDHLKLHIDSCDALVSYRFVTYFASFHCYLPLR
jgi:hypothetical protein